MAQEIGAILNSPWFDRGLAVVLVFYLLRGISHDIAQLTSAIIKLDANVRSVTAHQTARMTEIRDQNAQMRQFLGGISAMMARYASGSHHGPEGGLPRPD